MEDHKKWVLKGDLAEEYIKYRALDELYERLIPQSFSLWKLIIVAQQRKVTLNRFWKGVSVEFPHLVNEYVSVKLSNQQVILELYEPEVFEEVKTDV